MPKTFKRVYPRVYAFENLYQAFRKARKGGKRKKERVAAFELDLEANLWRLHEELGTQSYRPGPYHNFYVQERKLRLISAARFRDQVVHHALCNVIQPIFERRFIYDSYACRVGKGTHRAIDRAQEFARRRRYVLQCDVQQFFPSIDHQVLRSFPARHIADEKVLWLIDLILESGAGVLSSEYRMQWFPGDNLLAANRARGLPIGVRRESVLSDCSTQKCVLNLLFHQQYPMRYRGEVTSRVKPADNVSHSHRTAAESAKKWQVC